MLDQELIARPRQVAQEVAQLARQVLGADLEVIWFGSWPKGNANPRADVDIAVVGTEAFRPEQLARLRALADDVATLHEIDLVDLHTVGETFRDEILRDGIHL